MWAKVDEFQEVQHSTTPLNPSHFELHGFGLWGFWDRVDIKGRI